MCSEGTTLYRKNIDGDVVTLASELRRIHTDVVTSVASQNGYAKQQASAKLNSYRCKHTQSIKILDDNSNRALYAL
jgi:hypothetical protein